MTILDKVMAQNVSVEYVQFLQSIKYRNFVHKNKGFAKMKNLQKFNSIFFKNLQILFSPFL